MTIALFLKEEMPHGPIVVIFEWDGF